MTVLANIGRQYVLRVFPRGGRAVVATDAIANDIGVIEVRRRPGDSRVTVIAVVTARNMGRVLAGGRDAIMAGRTASQDLGVVDCHYRRPDRRAMTVFAYV